MSFEGVSDPSEEEAPLTLTANNSLLPTLDVLEDQS